MSLLVLAFAEFELPDPWQSQTTDSGLIGKKRLPPVGFPDAKRETRKRKSGKAKIRKLVQVSRKNGIHWRSQLVDAIETRSTKLGTAASKLSADLQQIARNNPTHQVGINARPIVRFEEIGRDAPKKMLAIAATAPRNNNRLVLALSGLSAIGTAGLYLSNRSNKK